MSDVFRTQDGATRLRDSHPELARLYDDPAATVLRAVWISTINGVVPLGASGNISHDTDFALLQHLRHQSDAVLVSRRTAIAERYRPIAQLDDETRPPLLVVLSRSPLPPEPMAYQGPDVLDAVVGTENIHFYRQQELLWSAPAGSSGLATVIDTLRGQGYRHLMCEGGPTIFSALLELDLVDEICATIAPFVAVGAPPTDDAAPRLDRYRLAASTGVDGYLFTRWCRDRRAEHD